MFEIGLRGQVARFTASTASYYAGNNQWYFNQKRAAEYGLIDVGYNAQQLVNAINEFLAQLGEQRYEVSYTWATDFMGYPSSYTVFIKAKEYSDELNFDSASASNLQGSYGSATITSTNAYPPSANYAAEVARCFGSSTGSIELNVIGGQAPYTFEWSDGSTEQNRSMLPRGTYKVIITDSAKPQPLNPDLPPDSFYQTFSEDHPGVVELTINVGENTQILVEGNIGNNSITVQVSGGTFPYTYSWSDGVTSKDRSDVEPGTYELTVRDALGCMQTVTFTISLERFFFSKNPVLLELQATNLEAKPNLRFICEVWVEPEYQSGNFLLATPDPFEHPADREGRTRFDVSEILDAFVEPHLPDFNQAMVKRADKAFKRFYLRYTEVYGDNTMDPFTVQDNRYVLCGGLDMSEHYANTFFRSFLPNRKPFFTWDPSVKPVFKNQPEHLFFMPNSYELTDFRVKVKVVFADGTTTTFQPYLQSEIKRFELYCIPVGHDQLGLGTLQSGKEVRSWDVYIVDGFANVLSETRRFTIDTRSYAQVRYFLYANSIGGYNTLAATGRAKLQVDAEAEVMERNRPLDADSGDAMVISKYSKRTLQMSTGYKSKAEIIALQDFLNSEDVRLVGSDRYIVGRLSDKSAVVSDDDPDKLPALSFDFILSKMHRYTPALRLAGYSDESANLTPLAP